MQKQMLCLCTLVIMSLAAMEKESKSPLQLTHQSPEITRIHSEQYLKWLEKQADKIAINSWCRTHANCDHTQLTAELQSVRGALKATNNIIKAKKNGITEPHLSIFFGDSTSFTGNKKLIKDYYHDQRIAYATIPIAAAHALHSGLFNRILVIDENIDDINPKTIKKYYTHGNGSLFYTHPNETTASLFNGKIITHDKINHASLWNFLNSDGKDIDLVFYNIDIDKIDTDQRKPNIFSLFQKLIPIIFIIPEEYCLTKKDTNYLTHYVLKTASKMSALFTPESKSYLYKFYYNNARSRTLLYCYNLDNHNTEIDDDSKTSSCTSSTSDNSEFESSYSEDSSDITSKSGSSDNDLDPFVFKITTHQNETKMYDGANQMLLAKNITITDDGVMEVILDPYYQIDSNYKRYNHSASISSNDDDNNGSSSNESSLADTIQENKLTHQSPEISCIHTHEYLDWLTNNRSQQELTRGLTWVAQALNATHAIKLKVASNVLAENKSEQPMYNICIIPDSFYAAGNNVPPQFGDLYAIIPIAAAYALQSGLFEKILIIEEHIDGPSRKQWTINMEEYTHQENGSIFHPNQKNKFFDLFNNKILIQQNGRIIDNYRSTTQVFFSKYPDNTNIDLAFYNIDEDTQDHNQRKLTITALLDKNIPTVFICSSQSIADDIENIIATYTKHSDEKGIVCKNKFYW